MNIEELQQQGYPALNTREGDRMGFLAQDFEQVFPDLVVTTLSPLEHGLDIDNLDPETEIDYVSTMAINYQGLIPVLVTAVQEQQMLITNLEARIEELENMMQE